MSWYTKATKREIRPGSTDPAIKPIGVILHVDAGNASSLYSYFNGPSGGIESHFFIRKDGVVEQYRDTGYEADANYKANSFVEGGVRKGYISVETQGYEEGEWTAAQIQAIKELLLWANKTHSIPLKKCATPTDPGVGYHTLFGAPSAWTPFSKSCPGPDRKRQFADVLVPWMVAVTAPPPPPKKDDDMPSAEEIAKAVWNYDRIPYNKPGSEVNSSNPVDKANPFWRPASVIEAMENRIRVLELKLDALIGSLQDDGK